MRGQAIVYETLERLGIQYEVLDHPAVFTVEELARVPFPSDVMVAKNLFLRDGKGKRFFLVVMPSTAEVNLRELGGQLGNVRLSFASEEKLAIHLNLTRGSVSPFGLLNNADHTVEAVIDSRLAGYGRLGVHPNDNTATVLLTYPDMIRVIEDHGSPITYL